MKKVPRLDMLFDQMAEIQGMIDAGRGNRQELQQQLRAITTEYTELMTIRNYQRRHRKIIK